MMALVLKQPTEISAKNEYSLGLSQDENSFNRFLK